jgi:hypothetical protein
MIRQLFTKYLGIYTTQSKSLMVAITLSFISLSFTGCGLDIEDPSPPPPPVWVQKSLPEEWPERGIDAHESGGIYLEWELNPDEDIAGYFLYRATWYDVNDSLGEFDLIAHLETESLAEGEYIDRQIVTRIRYFYKIKSQDLSDNISEFSDSLSFSLLPEIKIWSMSPNGLADLLGTARELKWRTTTDIETEDYCITLLREDNDFIARDVVSPGNYIGGLESYQISINIGLVANQIYKWRIDTGAIYMDGRETVGSESSWATFLYAGN